MKWVDTDLGDIVTFMSGGTPSKQKDEYWGGDIAWVSAKDLKGQRIYDSGLHITEAGAANGTRLVSENTILFVVRGMSLESEFRISLTKIPVTFNQDLKALCPSENIDPVFLFYSLYTRRDHIRQLASEASHGTKKLPTEVIKSIKLQIPDISTQKKVASIASAYDDLIENNRRRIQLLERSLHLLYKEWFVHLRFPSHEHSKIVDGIPEGWERDKVENIITTFKQSKKIKNSDYLKHGSIPCVDQSQDFIGGYTDDIEAVIDIGKPVIVFGDHTRVLKFIDFPFARGADGTQLIISKRDNLSQEFLYFSLEAINLSNYFYARHFKFLKDQFILIPSSLLIKQFTETAFPAMRQIKVLREQNRQLSQARDLLLPKLMSGAISV